MSGRPATIRSVWFGLHGVWKLNRKLSSTNSAEPSGNCTGTATFVSRQPAPFIDKDGNFQNASAEMLYSEEGEFTMNSAGSIAMRFPFTRKYVWRLQDANSKLSEISVWFVKPGTSDIDYLFHKFYLQNSTDMTTTLDFTGGHLCVEDFYSSQYSFHFEQSASGLSYSAEPTLERWEMIHKVRGPKKDQLISTRFERQDHATH